MTVAIPTNHSNAVMLPSADHAAGRLVEWAQAADAAYRVADMLCATQFAPAAYRGKAQEATAAILAGAEVGLSPMAALRAFDNIQGTPAPKALTLRAIVQGQGHEIRIDESATDRAVVSGRRKGDQDWQTSVWDMARAKQMGLTGKDQWQKQPGAMLIARATAEVCRWIAADAIMGMPYTAEEIRDGDGGFEPRPAPKRVTAAEILGTTDAPSASDDAAESVEMVRADQRRHMFALWNDLGYSGDENRAQRLQITAKILGLPEPLETSNDLTAADADAVIAALADRKAKRAAQAGEQA